MNQRRRGGRERTSAPTAAAAPYLFAGPAFVLLAAFGILPILVAVVVSLTDLDIVGLGDFSKVSWIGLDNYAALFRDADFWRALRNTAFFIGLGVPAIVVISMAVAVALNQSTSRYFRLLRSFYFLPSITAIVAISLIWGYLYNSQFGLLNYLLGRVGLGPVPWLTDPTVAKVSVAIVGVWRATGLNIIVFLAALQGIPREYYEASALDGAGRWRQTISITVPLLRFAIFFVTVTTLINWMQFFDEPFVLTRGEPAGATVSASLYIFQEGFRYNEFGFAAAASVVLFAIIFVVTSLQLRGRLKDERS